MSLKYAYFDDPRATLTKNFNLWPMPQVVIDTNRDRQIYCVRYDFVHKTGSSKIQKFKDSRGYGRNPLYVNTSVYPARSIAQNPGW